MSTPKASVVICSHNPRAEYLGRVIRALQTQTLAKSDWELLLIDNASGEPLADLYDLSWHPNGRHIRENELGLTPARLRGIAEAKGDLLVFVDDDNVLDPGYLRNTADAFNAAPRLGAAGGKAIPRYEIEPPAWFANLGISLACRDFGDMPIEMAWPDPGEHGRTYPEHAPIGAGLGIRREVCAAYVDAVVADPVRASLDRRGLDLSSGGDNDLIMSLLERGWKVAYLPQLCLEHLIPAHRLSEQYLQRYAYSTNKTWVQVLNVHGIRPWPAIAAWTVVVRKARAYVRNRGWRAAENYIRWRAACGMIDGRAAIAARR